MSSANVLWGAPRLHAELLKLGIEVSQATVAKHMIKHRKPPSQTWRTFLENHVKQLASVDFFVVPTSSFRILYVFLVLAHERRRVVHFNVTEHPTAESTAAQLMQAFPWDMAPRYLLRDRDRIYGNAFHIHAASMQITEVLTAPRSPWQSAHLERFMRSVKEECLDRMILFGDKSLRNAAQEFVSHYHAERNHQGLDNRIIEPGDELRCTTGKIAFRERLGGILRYYYRQAA
jgi:putative transposase